MSDEVCMQTVNLAREVNQLQQQLQKQVQAQAQAQEYHPVDQALQAAINLKLTSLVAQLASANPATKQAAITQL
jgi:hypothetical protein